MTFFHRVTPRLVAARGACLLIAATLAACSSVEKFAAGDKVDYRTRGSQTAGLEVPPDLTQLSRDARYQQPGASVSASTFQSAAATAPPVPIVAPAVQGEVKLERQGDVRWLVTSLPPEKLWPQLQAFWKERGFTLDVDQSDAGVMETNWAENRAKLPLDVIRRTIGRALENLYSTGELDKFRTRVERTPSGSEIYVTHRGMIEVYADAQRETTRWQPRPQDAHIEGEMLQRLMVKLGAKDEQAAATVAAAASSPTVARARVVEGQAAATLQVDDGFDRAWRRVGLALDRSGFTVEDRDRNQGVYFVRYVDPRLAGREEPGFFRKLFSFGRDKDERGGPDRYRVAVKSEGERSTVTVLNTQGAPENGAAAKRIVALLLEDLK